MVGNKFKHIVNDKTERYTALFALWLSSIFLPPAISNYLLIPILIFIFRVPFKFKKYPYFLVGFYVVFAAVAAALNLEYASFEKDVGKYLFLILIPFFFHHYQPYLHHLKLLKCFILSVVIIAVVGFVRASILAVEASDFSLLTYKTLAWNNHPGYLSLGLCVAYTWLIISSIFKDKWQSLLKLIILILVYLLSSRITWGIALVLCLVDIATQTLKFSPSSIKFLWYIPISVILIVFAVEFGQKESTRMAELEQSISSEESTSGSAGVRFQMWRAVFEDFRSFKLMGYGERAGNKKLKSLYQEKGISKAINFKLNAHNQYIQSFIYHGIVALFLLFLIPLFYWHWYHKNWKILLAFFPVYSFFLIESALMRQQGQLLFLITLLFLPILSKQSLNENT